MALHELPRTDLLLAVVYLGYGGFRPEQDIVIKALEQMTEIDEQM